MLVDVQSIIDKVIASVYFPGSAALTTAAQTALVNLDAAAATARKGSRAETQLMYRMAQITRIKTMDIVLMVDSVAINDAPNSSAIISSAGLEEKRTGARNVQTISVKQGTSSGSVIVDVKAQRGYSYKIQMQKGTTIDPLGWVDVTVSTLARIPVSGLDPINLYWFRVALIKGLSQGVYSNPASINVN